jgi:hypothetical protein
MRCTDVETFLRALAAMTVVTTGLATGGAQARVPSDPLAATWTYGAVNLPAAWDVTTGSEGVVIAIVDSGVDASHPDLTGAVDGGYDFVDEDTDASDDNGHGTAVAGIAGGRADNGLGAAGVCWRCRIMPLRVVGPDGFARWARIANAIDYAVEHGAAVVNASIYGESIDPALHYAIQRARAAGVLVVAAAGNEGRTLPEYPAAFPEVVSVAATTEQNVLASYSSHGDWVKLAAPACMPTSQIGGGFGPGCGTSGATPVVAGIIGLLRARAPFCHGSRARERDPTHGATRPRHAVRTRRRLRGACGPRPTVAASRADDQRDRGRRPDATGVLGCVGRCRARHRLPLGALSQRTLRAGRRGARLRRSAAGSRLPHPRGPECCWDRGAGLYLDRGRA